MHIRQAYELCCKYHGKIVCITDKKGRKHVGKITKVDRDMVWILPMKERGGYGLGFWGFGGGYGYGPFGYGGGGLGYGIALGAILGITLVSAFGW
ncbi:hypothetical protein CD30_07890 [Ureibacillus massiliensis 4400831 = CIP 108448 = CCUG 49529]|uniref:Uncharacterized protein n=1 Tax=Ureibacillus massiliensis 4400831 = CIP 108448 = CCUG 49529 TaxID=1211035 RepID=A0A0A3J1W0_9BACL|nr:hypothetical protein [Ureibacillus massiliensis]KGR90999.1 hypothetical protein CD30_07890 [Ureibacillus massiliensis 4400831 = CIP 108448 = CCUG 49529]